MEYSSFFFFLPHFGFHLENSEIFANLHTIQHLHTAAEKHFVVLNNSYYF